MEKQEKKERKVLTENRLTTINKRETSFEGLVSQLENGEDGVYNLITEDKNTIFRPKIEITPRDLKDIPLLAQLKQSIDSWKELLKRSEGKQAFVVKHAIIEMSRDQYLIKQAYRKPIVTQKLCRSKAPITLDLDLTDPKVISAILCNYSRLKQDSWDKFQDDTWYTLLDFDNIADKALRDYPLYERLTEYKVDGLTNQQI